MLRIVLSAIGTAAVFASIASYQACLTKGTPYAHCPTAPNCKITVTPAVGSCTLSPNGGGVRLNPDTDTLQFVYPQNVTGNYQVHFTDNAFPDNNFPVGYDAQKPNECKFWQVFGCNRTYALNPACGNSADIGVHVSH